MKRIFLTLLIFISFTSTMVFSQEVTTVQASVLEENPRFDVGAGYWHTWGNLDTVLISARDIPGVSLIGDKIQELNYDLDSGLFVVNAEAYLFWRLYADGFIGFGDIDDGEQVFKEWDWQVSHDVKYKSISDANGDMTTWDLNGYFRVLEGEENKGYLDIALGYLYYQDDIEEMPDIVEKIIDWVPTDSPLVGTAADEDSDRYKFDGIRLGARGRLKLHDRIAIKGGAGIVPWLNAKRDTVFHMWASPNNPDVLGVDIDSDADGLGFDLNIGAEIKLTKNLFIEVGYRYIDIETDVGDRSYSWSDGTVLEFEDGWKTTEVSRGGFYAMARFKI